MKKKSCQQIYTTLPEKREGKTFPQENTTILMNWENIIVPFCKYFIQVRLNLLPLAQL